MFLVVHLLRWSMKMIIVIVCKNAKLEFLLALLVRLIIVVVQNTLTNVDPRIELALALLVLDFEVNQELGCADRLL